MSNFYNPNTAPEVQAVLDAEHEEWKAEYEKLFIRLCHEREEFDGSVPCAYARKNGLGEPHHHNCWVAMLSSMGRLGYATRVKDVTVPGSSTHSHNNNVSYWTSNLYQK